MSILTSIFSRILGVEEERVTPDLSPENTPSWDSLNAIILMTEIEKAFDAKFSFDEAMTVKNFGDVIELVASKGKDPNLS